MALQRYSESPSVSAAMCQNSLQYQYQYRLSRHTNS